MAKGRAKMGNFRKAVLTLLLLLVFGTAAAYVCGFLYFSSHFLPGSMVNGFNCSYMTAAETEALLSKRVKAYVIAVETMNNGQEAVTAEDIGMDYQSSGAVDELIQNQNRFQWFLAFNQDRHYDVAEDLVYDEDKLTEAISGLKCLQYENMTQPSDAQIHYNEETEAFEIVPEVTGNALDPLKVKQVVLRAMLTGATSVNLEEEACYLKPSVYSTDEQVIANCEKMNTLCEVIVTYDFADRKETVDRSVIKDWFTYDEDGNVILSEEAIAAYVAGLAEKYDTVGVSRVFRTYSGQEVTVPAGGDYGWVIDQEGETQALMEVIETGVTQVREPVYSREGWSRDTNDIGYTYVEIDLTNQRLVFYKDGQPTVDTSIVSGNPNIEGCATPTGCFSIDAMQSPATLVGEDYQSEVSFWMPFSGNVGIHDAPWRTEFGNNLYLLEGSHGCVNIPYDKAAALYQNVEVGMPVVVYEQ